MGNSNKTRQIQQSTHYTLVISKKPLLYQIIFAMILLVHVQKVQTGNEANSNVELEAPQAQISSVSKHVAVSCDCGSGSSHAIDLYFGAGNLLF